tara:strand:- start:378 stop:926 length:549 start_codon:yes stop_codon:yes gene_type:complete
MQSSHIQFAQIRLTLTVILVMVFLFGQITMIEADDGSREKIDGDLILMQGKWNLVDFVYYRSHIAERAPKGQRQGIRIVSGNRYRLKLRIGAQQVDDEYSFQLYSQQKPKAFDVTLPDGETVIKGIYEVGADTLRRAYSQPGAPRPTQFQSGDQTYQVWKRIAEPPAGTKQQTVNAAIKKDT